ncbi:MAG: class I SAM-dependent methyltransferase [Sedimenticolaceae bacterium]
MSYAPTPDRAAQQRRIAKAHQQATWADGDYGRIGITLITGERLLESTTCAGLSPLDIASGNGNAAPAAARRYRRVTATDLVPDLLAQSQARALAEHADIDYATVDAQHLPYADNAFDQVTSTFGVMFAPASRRPHVSCCVCRPGGRVGLASWTPDGVRGALFPAAVRLCTAARRHADADHVGTHEFIARQFGERASDSYPRERDFVFRYRSP